MKDVNKFLYVAERDIDLLLLEEVNVCPEFSSWLFQQTCRDSENVPSCNGAWHSFAHPQLGESDLVVTYEDGTALLIENKVDAPAQRDQVIRYRTRGEKGCDEMLWKSFVTCIIAPERYLKSNTEAQKYDARISYETIRDWFQERKSQRSEYRAYVLGEAIEQNRRGYSPVADDDVTQFWLSYWKVANEHFPDLKMPRPGIKPANSDWPDFRPSELGKELSIVHKMAHGYVDLQVRGASERLDRIRSLLSDPALEVVAAGNSGAVRIVVPPVDRFGSFDAQRDSIIHALEAAERLFKIANGMRNDI